MNCLGRAQGKKGNAVQNPMEAKIYTLNSFFWGGLRVSLRLAGKEDWEPAAGLL